MKLKFSHVGTNQEISEGGGMGGPEKASECFSYKMFPKLPTKKGGRVECLSFKTNTENINLWSTCRHNGNCIFPVT